MAKCAKCGESASLPYLCRRCNKYYCAKHRLPESHDCIGLHESKEGSAQKRAGETALPASSSGQPVELGREKEPSGVYVSVGPNDYWSSYRQSYTTRRGKIRFSRVEVQHLLMASALLVLLSLSLTSDFPFGFSSSFDLNSFIILTAILFLVFLPHELMHKVVAQRYGLFAEFRIIPSYAMLTLVTILLPLFRVFAPGAVMIGGEPRPEAYGKTAAAGPATNVAIGAAMVALFFSFPGFAFFFWLGAFYSSWLALFNLIPVAPLDGEKILHWNRGAFSVLFVASIALFAWATYLLLV